MSSGPLGARGARRLCPAGGRRGGLTRPEDAQLGRLAENQPARLGRAGFGDVDTWLQPSPVTPDDPLTFAKTVCLGPHLERLPEELRDGFARAVCDRAGPELDYVRLNIDAKKPR